MRLFGSFPSPFGVSVPVHQADGSDELLFCAEATAICAGIYSPQERIRFAKDAARAGAFPVDRLAEYGGTRVAHTALPRPTSPATLQIPLADAPDIPLDAWVNSVMDQSRWCDRSDALLEAMEGNLGLHDDEGFEPILVLGLRIIMTSALEHLGEKTIDCLEAAAFYALSMHPEWQAPALKWLQPVAQTWWRDWVSARPALKRVADASNDLPSWFCGGVA